MNTPEQERLAAGFSALVNDLIRSVAELKDRVNALQIRIGKLEKAAKEKELA